MTTRNDIISTSGAVATKSYHALQDVVSDDIQEFELDYANQEMFLASNRPAYVPRTERLSHTWVRAGDSFAVLQLGDAQLVVHPSIGVPISTFVERVPDSGYTDSKVIDGSLWENVQNKTLLKAVEAQCRIPQTVGSNLENCTKYVEQGMHVWSCNGGESF